MNWKTKTLTGVGTMLVLGATTGTVAFADTTNANPSSAIAATSQRNAVTPTVQTAPTANTTNPAKVANRAEAKALFGQLKSLRAQLKSTDGQIHATWQSVKGQRPFNGDAALRTQFKAAMATDRTAKAAVKADHAALKAARSHHEPAQRLVLLQKTVTDLQNLVNARGALLQILQSAASNVHA